MWVDEFNSHGMTDFPTRRPLVASLLALAAVFAVSNAPPTQDYALCSPGGKIYTVDAAHPNVECIVVSSTTIVDVGSLGASTQFTVLLSDSAQWTSRHVGVRDMLGVSSTFRFHGHLTPCSPPYPFHSWIKTASLFRASQVGHLMTISLTAMSTIVRRPCARVAIRPGEEP